VRVDGSHDRLDRDRLYSERVSLGGRCPATVHRQVHEVVAVRRPSTQAPFQLGEAAFAAEPVESVLGLEPARAGDTDHTVKQTVQQEQRRDEAKENARDSPGCNGSRRERRGHEQGPQRPKTDTP
jgi:hypothetical protein